MTMTPRFALAVLLGALALAVALLAADSVAVAHADSVAGAHADASVIDVASSASAVEPVAPAPTEPTVDEVRAVWRRGDLLGAGVLVLFGLLVVAARVDRRRALWYTAGLTALGACVELVHAGQTPSAGMLIGAGAVFVALITRSPLQPAAAADARSAREPQRGSVAGSVLLLLLALAIIWVPIVSASCSGGQRRAAIESVVDCTIGVGKQHADEYSALIEQVLRAATSPDGSVDWTVVRAAAVGFGLETGGCAIAAAVVRLLAAPPGYRAGSPAPSTVRAGWELLRAEQLGGRRFRVAGGAVL